ncbi:MAG: Clp protease N-terminal domain-containing protein, partial [Butyricicoccaceae bacterium]
MNLNQFTQKSIEAIQAAQSLAVENGNQQVSQPHVLLALLQQKDGLIGQLIDRMGVPVDSFTSAVSGAVGALPKVSGGGREPDKIYVSQQLDQALNAAEKQAGRMKDDFVSVEHIFLGLIQNPESSLKQLFQTFEITEQRFLTALKDVRGNQRVTSDNPEETYDVLQKYGQDLVERARAQKLDPVIGRDSEIRNVIRILSRKTKNNPVLIGEPGVGKTAIAEGLAQRIVRGDVPENLKDRKI